MSLAILLLLLTPSRVELSLDEAVSRSLMTSAKVDELEALEHAASYAVARARAERRPEARLSLSYSRNSEVPEFVVPGGVLFPSIENNYRSRVGVSVPLYTGGKLGAQVETARREEDAMRSDLDAGRSDLVLETIVAYWNLVELREGEKVLTRGVESFEAHRIDAENRRRVGLVAANEVLAVEVEKERAELNRIRAVTRARVAEANLLRLVGLPDETELVLTEVLTAQADDPGDVSALVQRALESRPEPRALAERVEAAKARVKVVNADRFPFVFLSGGLDYNNPNLKVLPPLETWQRTWDVGVSLSWSVFDAGRRGADEARALAQLDALESRLRDLYERVALDVRSRRLELLAARDAIAVADKALASAEENRRVSRDQYRAGLVPSSDLLDAEVGLLRAGLERTEALAAAREARARLDRAVGDSPRTALSPTGVGGSPERHRDGGGAPSHQRDDARATNRKD